MFAKKEGNHGIHGKQAWYGPRQVCFLVVWIFSCSFSFIMEQTHVSISALKVQHSIKWASFPFKLDFSMKKTIVIRVCTYVCTAGFHSASSKWHPFWGILVLHTGYMVWNYPRVILNILERYQPWVVGPDIYLARNKENQTLNLKMKLNRCRCFQGYLYPF